MACLVFNVIFFFQGVDEASGNGDQDEVREL